MTTLPYELDVYARITTPSAVATTGTVPLAAISIPLCDFPQRPPKPDETYPALGRLNVPDETAGALTAEFEFEFELEPELEFELEPEFELELELEPELEIEACFFLAAAAAFSAAAFFLAASISARRFCSS